MRDFVCIEEKELLDVGEIMLLPDTMMMMTGECFLDMLPRVSSKKRGAPKQWDGGYSGSIRYTREEIEQNPVLALSPEEYRTLRLHMQGRGPKEIAGILGITEVGVAMRLRKHRVKLAKVRMLEEVDEHISGLLSKAVDVYGQGLEAKDIRIRLKAAKDVLNINGKGVNAPRAPDAPPMNAHDYMSTLLQKFEANINVHVGTSETSRVEQQSLDGNSRRIGNTIDVEDSE